MGYTADDLLRLLDEQLTRQKPSADPAVKQRIDELYAEGRNMIGKYVDVDMLNQLRRELAQARTNPAATVKPANASSPAAKEPSAPKNELPPALKSANAAAAQ